MGIEIQYHYFWPFRHQLCFSHAVCKKRWSSLWARILDTQQMNLAASIGAEVNGTTTGLGYWKVGLEWPYITTLPLGSESVTACTIKLEDMDGLND